MKIRTLAIALGAAAVAVACGRSGGDRVVIQNKGSDTMVNLAQAWAENYREAHPSVAVAVTGGGSGTGIAAIMNGTVDIANASREIKAEELATAKKNTGKEPKEFTVAFDALAVYVHPANPLTQISKSQLACIYGEGGTCENWSSLQVEIPGCAEQQIVRVSRQNNSGTYAYFREWTLGESKDFKLGSRDMQGSKDVVDLIEHTPCAIGYSGIGYRTKGVKVLCVAGADGAACVEPTPATTLDRSYPISRALYMYTLGDPAGEIARYLQWIRSDVGQSFVEKAGYVPIPTEMRQPQPQ